MALAKCAALSLLNPIAISLVRPHQGVKVPETNDQLLPPCPWIHKAG